MATSDQSLKWTKNLSGIPKFSIIQIAEYIKENGKNRAFDEGYNLFIESFIHEAFVCKNDKTFMVKAKCWNSQGRNETPHAVSADIDEKDGKVLGGRCSCIAGTEEVCNHIIALLYTVNHWVGKKMQEIWKDMSCTEADQVWHKPREDKIEVEPVMKMAFAKSTTDRRLRKREPAKCYLYDTRAKKSKMTLGLSEEEFESIQTTIGGRNDNIPIAYLTKSVSTTQTVDTLFGEVPIGSPLSYQLKDYHSSRRVFSAYIPSSVDTALPETLSFPNIPIPQTSLNIDTSQLDYASKTILHTLDISKAKAEETEQSTIDQSHNPLWHEMRRDRLTASNFGDVINRKSAPSASFMKDIFTPKDLSNDTSHGSEMKNTARKMYTKRMRRTCHHDVTVFQTGLLINPCCPYLGASPDGKVIDRSSNEHFGLLEIKCPYKYRNNTPEEAAENAAFCLEIRNGELHLKRSHSYYYQVLGQMAIAGIQWCDFVVFTNKGLFVERIYFDNTVWATIFPKLAQFYINTAIPYLTSIQKSNCASKNPS